MISASVGESHKATGGSQQVKLAEALVSVAWSLGAVKRAFSGTVPTAVHDDMIHRSRNFAQDAASLIQAFNCGDGFDDPETFLILFELFLLRDVSTCVRQSPDASAEAVIPTGLIPTIS